MQINIKNDPYNREEAMKAARKAKRANEGKDYYEWRGENIILQHPDKERLIAAVIKLGYEYNEKACRFCKHKA